MAEAVICGRCGTRATPTDRFCQICGDPLNGTATATAGAGPGWTVVPGAAAGDGRPAAAPPPDISSSEATRLLCAGAHLDDEFSRRVTEEVFGQTWRAVPPSYGFDLRLVLLHCLDARRRRRIVDAMLVAIAVAMLVAGAVPTVLFGVAAALLGGVVSSLGAGTGRHGWRYGVGMVVLLLIAAAIYSAFVTFAHDLGQAAAPAVQPGLAQPAVAIPDAVSVIGGLLSTFALVLGGWVLLYLVVLADLLVRRQRVVSFRPASFAQMPVPSVPLSARMRRRLDVVAQTQGASVTVYDGFDPFIGAGEALTPEWAFAIPLQPARGMFDEAPKDVTPFTVAELVDRVGTEIRKLSAEPAVDHPLPGLEVSDHVFVSGGAIDDDARFLPRAGAAPNARVDPVEVRAIANDPHGPIRHYCSARVTSWGGEVVAFTFLHFSADGEKLYVECVKRVLRPVRRAFHSVDLTPETPSLADLLRLAAEAAGETVGAVLGAPGRAISDLVFDLHDDRPPVDTAIFYGARLSLREVAAERTVRGSYGFHSYFQLLDAEKHLKVVERQSLAAMCDFLEEHGYDSSEFKRQQGGILNRGVIQVGTNNLIGAAAWDGGQADNSGPMEQQAS